MSDYTANLRLIMQTADDFATLVEFYPPDQTPDASNGFDPADAVLRFSDVGGVTFYGQTYTRLVKSYGTAKRTLTNEINSFSVAFDNLENIASDFEFATGFEGLILILRIISRSQSVLLSDSLVVFPGRCDQPNAGNREELSVTSKHVLGALNTLIPRRKFTPEDEAGRHYSDVLFEGFRFMPRYSNVTYTTRERRGGLAGLLGFKKTVTHTIQYSSYSDLDADRYVPEVLGRCQMSVFHIAYFDLGTFILMVSAFCEGVISAYTNERSETPGFSIAAGAGGGFVPRYGLLGNVGSQVPNPDNRFNGWGNGYYSRLAYAYIAATGSQISTIDPAPTVAAVILGKLMATPTSAGEWSGIGWSANGAAQLRWLITSPDYFNLDEAWIDDDAAFETYNYNNEFIFDKSLSDFIFAPDSASFAASNGLSRHFPSTALATPELFKLLNKDVAEDETYFGDPAVIEYTNLILPEDENSIDPNNFPTNGTGTGGVPGTPGTIPGEPTLSFFIRRRFTSNVAITEEYKAFDFANEVLLPASRMFMSNNAQGQIKINSEKPADYALAETISSATSISVDDVSAWVNDISGVLLISPHTTTSEVRDIQSALYSTDQNSIGLTASANIGIAGFGGCDGATTPATATLTVNTAATTNTFTLDGVQIDFIKGTNDTVKTIAGFIYGAINGHPRLSRRFVATWDANTAIVTIKGKFGAITVTSDLEFSHPAPLADPATAPTLAAASGGTFEAGTYRVGYSHLNDRGETVVSPIGVVALTANQKIVVTGVTALGDSVNWFCSPAKNSFKLRLVNNNNGAGFDITAPPKMTNQIPVNINRTGTEVIRCAQAFTDKLNTRANLTRSNVLQGTFEWLLGNREKPINRIDLEYRDSTQDFRKVELRLRDDANIAKTNKTNPLSVNGQAIDSYNQAYRIASNLLAKHQDANFLYKWSSDREALLLQEGDVVAITDSGSGVVNFPVRIEEIDFTDLAGGFPKVTFTARKYSTTLYDDSVAERIIPIVIESSQSAAANDLQANQTLLHEQSGVVFSDSEKTGSILELTLPDIQDAIEYSAHVTDAAIGIKFIAGADAIIRVGQIDSATAGTVESTEVGSFIRLKCYGAVWKAEELQGSWEVN